jgi:hypothetical protein
MRPCIGSRAELTTSYELVTGAYRIARANRVCCRFQLLRALNTHTPQAHSVNELRYLKCRIQWETVEFDIAEEQHRGRKVFMNPQPPARAPNLLCVSGR